MTFTVSPRCQHFRAFSLAGVSCANRYCSLKAEGQDNAALAPKIAELVALKADFESVTGAPFDPPKKAKANKPKPSKKGDASSGKVRESPPRVMLSNAL